MRTKLLAICLAAVGLGSVAVSGASAREVVPARAAALPATVRVNEVVIAVGDGHRHYYRHHRHSRSVRRVYYRHGHRYVTYRRVFY